MFNLKLTNSQTVLFHTLESLLVGALIAGFVAILQYFESNSGNVNWNALLGVFTSVVAGALLKGLLGAAVTTPATPAVQPVAQGPLVQITHNAPADTQVSSAALPHLMNTAPLLAIPPGQSTLPSMMPQGTAVQTGAVMGGVTMFAPPDVLPGGASINPVIPFSQPPQGQDWRNWTGLTQVPPTQQQ